MHEIPYTTVMYWLQTGKVEGAVKHQTPTGHYWELPDDTPRPPSMAGRPKKQAQDSTDELPFEPPATKPKPRARKTARKATVRRSAKKGGAAK